MTHRDDASAVAFVTGHEDPDKDESALDWEALARFPGHARPLHGGQAAARDRRALIAAGRDAGRAGGGGGARDDGGPADRDRDAGRDRRARSAEAGLEPPAIVIIGPVAAAARRSPGSSGGRSTAGASSSPGRAPRPAASRRRCARSAPRSSSCRRSGSCRGSTRPRCATRSQAIHTYALVCLTSPNGVEAAVRGDRRGGPRRARARQRDGRRDRPRHRGGARRARDRAPTSCRSARSPRRWSRRCADVEVAGRPVLVARAAEARDVLPDALRERGAKVDVVAALRDGRRGARPGGDRGRAGRRLRHLHLLLDGAQPGRGGRRRLPGARPGRLDRPGDQRRRARGRARGRRRGRAPRPRRPGRGAARGRWPRAAARSRAVARPITFLSDYGYDDEFVGRLPRRDRADRARRHGDRPHPRDPPPRGPPGRAASCANALPYAPPGVHLAVVDPGVGSPRRRVAVRVGDGRPDPGRPRQRAALAARSSGSAARSRRSTSRSRRSGSSRSRRPSTAATCSRRSPPTWRSGRRSRTPGEAIDPAASLTARAASEPRIERRAGSSPTSIYVDRFGNVVARPRRPAPRRRPGCGSGDRVAVRGGRSESRRRLHAHLRRRRPRRAASSTRTPTRSLALAVNRDSAAERLRTRARRRGRPATLP